MNITDKLTRATDSSTSRPIIATLAAPGKTVGAPSVTLSAATNWTTMTPVYVAMYTTTAAGIKDPTSQTDWKATLSGATLSNLTLTGGTDRTYAAGAYVEITYTAAWAKDLYDALSASLNPDGSLKTPAVQQALNLGNQSSNGWTPLGYTPATVTYNGNRSYTLQFNGVDLTSVISAGMRLLTTRTVAAPTQSTSLNGTTQYYSKTSPAGMTFTDDFVVSAWVKLSAYPGTGNNFAIASRYNGTSGWVMQVSTTGQLFLYGFNAASANYSEVNSYQSLPLNKWVHVAAQLDMSTFTATTTTSYVMIDGVDVPAQVARTGTNPTALVQAGNLEIGSLNGGGSPWNGKIAQAFVTSAKLTQTQVKAIYSQGLVSADMATYSIISAYSFNNTVNDINTTNANNLTANGSAVATNADSPFGNSGVSGTLDYAIVMANPTFSTNTTVTVQVPEGCTIPTSGGVTNVQYSNVKAPYGFPAQASKWTLVMPINANQDKSTGLVRFVLQNINGINMSVPVGSWKVKGQLLGFMGSSVSQALNAVQMALSTSTTLDITNGFPGSRLFASFVLSPSSGQADAPTFYVEDTLDVAVATPLYVLTGSNAPNIGLIRTVANTSVALENAYL